MTKARGRVQQTRGLVDMSVTPTVEAPQPWNVPPEETDAVEYMFDAGERDRFHVRQRLHRGALIEFCVVHRAMIAGEYVEVARTDTRHDEVHVHFFTRSGEMERLVLHKITSIADIEEGWQVAHSMLVDGADANVGRWHRG